MLEHFEREYSVNKKYLYWLGAWPYQNKLSSNLITISCLVYELSYYPLQILMLYDYWNDPELVFEICYQFVSLTGFIVKMFNPIWNREKLKRICILMNDHWNIFTSKMEVQTLKDSSNISRKLTVGYTTWISFLTVFYLITPLTPVFLDIIDPLNETRPRLFPVTANFRIDEEKYYAQLYVYIVSMILIGVSNAITTDCIYLVSIIHACSLFSTISRQLEEIVTKFSVKKDTRRIECCIQTKLEFENEQMIYQEYIKCLKKYQLALEFVDILNSAYEMISLFLLLLYGATATFIAIQILNILDRFEDVLRYMFEVVAMLVQLIILCYSGQKLRDESQNVFHRAYAAEWYNCSPRLKSLLIITLYRSSIPCGLTAGNMMPLSIETYGFVVRTILSYFMTFLSLKEAIS
ncbi:odorant receptor 63a-like [Linepithema humile]|uniref:odorant receptor 63a-like n=1 Tax=Linepithema humile TaxID=83485 RepID=UPI00351F701F